MVGPQGGDSRGFGWARNEPHLHNALAGGEIMPEALDINITTMEGTHTTLRELGGTRWLVVNVASACGATPQYKGLQEIHAGNEDITVVGSLAINSGHKNPEPTLKFVNLRLRSTMYPSRSWRRLMSKEKVKRASIPF